MNRIIVTGANGAGKSHLAARLALVRPGIPVVSFDAIKLTRNWVQRPRAEIDADLARVVADHAWILEGGPSLLAQALDRAEAVIWLDPPAHVRAWRLAVRPLRNRAMTRPELPPGNPDTLLRQYGFAVRSLSNGRRFRRAIAARLEAAPPATLWHCRSQAAIDAAVAQWHARA